MHWVKVKTWSPNCLLTEPASLLLADTVTGALTASYGGYMAAVLEDWRPCTPFEWSMYDRLPDVNPWSGFDAHPLAISGLPCLGGRALYYAGPALLTGVRIAPPPLGPRRYHEATKWKRENPDADPQAEEERENERQKSKKRREDQGKSTKRYAHFRETRGRSRETRNRRRD